MKKRNSVLSTEIYIQDAMLSFIVGTFEHVVSFVLRQTQKCIVLACPVYDLSLVSKNVGIRSIYRQIDFFTTDGMPLVWWFQRRTKQQIDRVYGPDLMRAVLHNAHSQARHCFICPNQAVYAALSNRFRNEIQQQKYFFSLFGSVADGKEKKRVANWIMHVSPRYVWIGIGSPNQAKLAVYLKQTLPTRCIYFCVGAALPFLAGTTAQAPRWVRNIGLEWLFRLSIEPGRLWKRYLIDSPWFLFRLLFVTIHFSHEGINTRS